MGTCLLSTQDKISSFWHTLPFFNVLRDSVNKVKWYFIVFGTYLRVEVKETVVFKPQQQHLILLYILLHQRPGWVQPPVQSETCCFRQKLSLQHLWTICMSRHSSSDYIKCNQAPQPLQTVLSPLVDFGFVQQRLVLVEFGQDVWWGDGLAHSEDAGVSLREGAVPKPGGGGRQRAAVSGVIGGGHRLTVQAWAGVDAPWKHTVIS